MSCCFIFRQWIRDLCRPVRGFMSDYWVWIATAAVFILYFFIGGFMYNYCVLFGRLQEEFHYNAALTGKITIDELSLVSTLLSISWKTGTRVLDNRPFLYSNIVSIWITARSKEHKKISHIQAILVHKKCSSIHQYWDIPVSRTSFSFKVTLTESLTLFLLDISCFLIRNLWFKQQQTEMTLNLRTR